MTSSNAEKHENRPAIDDVGSSDVETSPQEPQLSKEEEIQYPKGLAVAAIMSAVWLSLFLVALVGPQCSTISPPHKAENVQFVWTWKLTPTTGSNNSSHRRTQNHRSVPLTKRCWLVRQFLHAH
jgi:hypothetical protein